MIKKLLVTIVSIVLMLSLSSCGIYHGIDYNEKEEEIVALTTREQEVADAAGFPRVEEAGLSTYELHVIKEAVTYWEYLDEKYEVEHKPIYQPPLPFNQLGEVLFYREDDPEVIFEVYRDGGLKDNYLDAKLDHVMSDYITKEFLDQEYADVKYKACMINRYNDDDNFDIDHLLNKEEGIGLIYFYFSISEILESRSDIVVQDWLNWIEANTNWQDHYCKIYLMGDLFFEIEDLDTLWPGVIYDIHIQANRSYHYIKSVVGRDGEVTVSLKEKDK